MRIFLLFVVVATSSGCKCSEQVPAAPAAIDAGTGPITRWKKDPAMGYEAEVAGSVEDLDRLAAPRYVVLVTPEPCDPARLDTAYVSALGHPDPGTAPKAFRVEPTVRDHEKLYICALALDSTGKTVLGFGAYPKNPLEFVKPPDEDELEIDGLSVPLRKLVPPVGLAADRF